MSDSPLRTTWQYVQRYWHWPVLLVAGIYLYQQYLPSIELAEPGRPAPTLVDEPAAPTARRR